MICIGVDRKIVISHGCPIDGLAVSGVQETVRHPIQLPAERVLGVVAGDVQELVQGLVQLCPGVVPARDDLGTPNHQCE